MLPNLIGSFAWTGKHFRDVRLFAERWRIISMLSPQHVEQAYREAHEDVRMIGDRVPRASAVQELVIARKLLWKWRNRA
jgi:hypothetical protein